jgi:hypothetical protein
MLTAHDHIESGTYILYIIAEALALMVRLGRSTFRIMW